MSAPASLMIGSRFSRCHAAKPAAVAAKLPDRRGDKAARTVLRPSGGRSATSSAKPPSGRCRPEQQHVVEAQHRRIGGVAVGQPDRAGIEAVQGLAPRLHVGEAAQPHETVRIVEIAELADDRHALGFLALDQLAIEDVDQRIAGAGHKIVLAQFDDRRQRRGSGRPLCCVIACRLLLGFLPGGLRSAAAAVEAGGGVLLTARVGSGLQDDQPTRPRVVLLEPRPAMRGARVGHDIRACVLSIALAPAATLSSWSRS